MSTDLRVFLGWEPREAKAYDVAARSIRSRASSFRRVDIQAIQLDWLRDRGWYRRPTERRDGQLWDVISDAPMSTEHAISRFFVPMLCGFHGWAMSADCDILCRADIGELFLRARDDYAVMVVKHEHNPGTTVKMDGQIQTRYARKNWSSVMLWNCGHPAHQALTLDVLNSWPGRDLHAFNWLDDEQIGSLPAGWNHLVGVSHGFDVKIAHFTLGTPDMVGYETCDFADEWRGYLREAVA